MTFPYLVKKKRRAVASSNARRRVSAPYRRLFPAEKLAQRAVTAAGTVDLHHQPVTPATVVMDCLGNQLLAGSCFAAQERWMGGGYLLHQENTFLIGSLWPMMAVGRAARTPRADSQPQPPAFPSTWLFIIGMPGSSSLFLYIALMKTSPIIWAGQRFLFPRKLFCETGPGSGINRVVDAQWHVQCGYHSRVTRNGGRHPPRGSSSRSE
jgi:hypothetical protein